MPDEYDQYQQAPNFGQNLIADSLQQQQLIQKWMLDNTEELVSLEHNLKGEIFDPIEKKWKPPTKYSPIVNERGLYSTMLLLNSYLTKNYMLSNLTEDDINFIMIEFVQTVTSAVYQNYKEWNLEMVNWGKYLMMLEHFVLAIIKRSQDHLQLDLTAQTNRYNETHVIREGQPDFQQKKKNPFWGGG